jgi:hypothetical protein
MPPTILSRRSRQAARAGLPGLLALAIDAGLVGASTSSASAPPIGPLPKADTTTMATKVGSLVAVALPPTSKGLVWRLARRVDPAVASEVDEADVGRSVVIVFRANGQGKASITYAATRGETPKAYRAITYRLTVTAR